MKKNMGNIDKAIRIVIALIVGTLFYTDIITGTIGIILLVLSAVFVLTSLLSICPIYSILGLSTCPLKNKK